MTKKIPQSVVIRILIVRSISAYAKFCKQDLSSTVLFEADPPRNAWNALMGGKAEGGIHHGTRGIRGMFRWGEGRGTGFTGDYADYTEIGGGNS